MADETSTNKLTGQTITLMVMCAAAVAVVIVLGVLPSYLAYQKSTTANADLRRRLDDLAILQPVRAEAELAARSKRPEAPTIPKRAKMKAVDMPGLAQAFTRMARDCGLELVYAFPEAESSLESKYTLIMFKLLAQGPVEHYRDFMLAVIALPAFDYLHHVEILRAKDTENLRLEFWVAID